MHVTPPANSSDAELAHRAGRGDNDAFAALYARHAGALVAFVRARVSVEAGDILHEVWVRISEGLDTYDGGSVRAWALEVTRSVLAERRRSVTARAVSLDDFDPFAPEQEQVQKPEQEQGEDDPFAGHREGLARCLEGLSRAEVQVVRARLEGIESARIAERGKVPVERVHSLFLQASARLAGCLEEERPR